MLWSKLPDYSFKIRPLSCAFHPLAPGIPPSWRRILWSYLLFFLSFLSFFFIFFILLFGSIHPNNKSVAPENAKNEAKKKEKRKNRNEERKLGKKEGKAKLRRRYPRRHGFVISGPGFFPASSTFETRSQLPGIQWLPLAVFITSSFSISSSSSSFPPFPMGNTNPETDP